MDAFDIPVKRDTSITTQCVKCAVKMMRIQILNIMKTGFYICESCYKKLEEKS